MRHKKVYIIGGPTAGGKSEAALKLAHQRNGVIINADSMQIYADLRILSARPDELETEGILHLLYGYADAWSHGNVMEWVLKAADMINTYHECIVVGGTGMYLDALMHGMSDIPEVDPDIRSFVRTMPIEEVKARVQACSATDDQRLRRALEVQLSTGKPLSFFLNKPRRTFVEADFEPILIMPPREVLYNRCDRRFLMMLEKGAEEEVRRLKALNPSGGVLKAIGVKEIMAYHAGELSRSQMIEHAQRATRQYAKRQVTWFRHRLKAPVLQSASELD